MKQITKLYISSFLKNQTYFTPIMVLFLQFNNLSLQEIFIVFTIGSIISFLFEIPTGIFADFYGKKRSIIISKTGIFISYIIFGFSNTFWMFVLAQVVLEIGNSFRSGTETAYTYDYLLQNQKNNPRYTEVKGKQKFYARIGEGIATSIGGLIASVMGFNAVFFIAAFPAGLNVINALSWENIKETKTGFRLKKSILHINESFKSILNIKDVFVLTLNITIFTAVLVAMSTFIQPYMIEAGIPIAFFGFIYTFSLILAAITVRYSYVVEEKFGTIETINIITFFAIVPAIIIGLAPITIFGVILFFMIIVIENIRSPIANSEFNMYVASKKRATTGSILSLSKSFGKMVILPFVGYLTDTFSMSTAIIVLAIILLINSGVFYIRKREK